MNSKELITVLDDIFIPISFKRRKNKWVRLTSELSITLYLQKSQYGNFFYLRYFFTILSIDPSGKEAHVVSGLGSQDAYHSKRIKELLDLDSEIDDKVRSSELKEYTKDIVIAKIGSINTARELYSDFIIKYARKNVVMGVASQYYRSLGYEW